MERTLLDIGTGTGYFAHTMQKAGWLVSAIEKSPQARDFAYEKFGLIVLDEHHTDQFDDNTFDVITLWHVMEHIEHLDELWETLRRELKPNGVLIVAVPNCQSYDAIHYQNNWAAFDVPRHLWHFSPDTLKLIARKHRFEVDSIKGMPFDSFYISMLSEKYKKHTMSVLRGGWQGAKCLLKSFNKPAYSSSVIYILRKKKG